MLQKPFRCTGLESSNRTDWRRLLPLRPGAPIASDVRTRSESYADASGGEAECDEQLDNSSAAILDCE